MTDKPDKPAKPVALWRDVGRGVGEALGGAALSTVQTTVQITQSFKPLFKALSTEEDVDVGQLSAAIDAAFTGLYQHPLMRQTERVTRYLRGKGLIPNEQSTENLIRFMVDQSLQRSPVTVPDMVVKEFWLFFDELFSAPELKGLGELSLDMGRLVVKTYEPMLVEILNLLKAKRRFNQWQWQEMSQRATLVREDAAIVRRQIRALRHIKPFFDTDPKDFKRQAEIVAEMVREFGPFFVKMAQVAAANADFLPEEIARELAVFHEDVPPMSEAEVLQAFIECYGKPPHKLYLDFDASKPVKSGSIGSVYFAKKPFIEHGKEVLRPVVIKVGRHNIDREFVIGKMVMGLAIMSSQYWAPHSKLAPFLRAMQEQVDEFVAGFLAELDFETEAQHHLRFYQRSQQSQLWHVPQLYGSARRILEMEYLSEAQSLPRALAQVPKGLRRGFQQRVFERLLYAVVSQIVQHQEMHGDLHPGNVMIDSEGRLHLIDWGNVVPLKGRFKPVWDYLSAAVMADTERLTEALLRISTQPNVSVARRQEIKAMLDDTLKKKGIAPLTRRRFWLELQQGWESREGQVGLGWENLRLRLQTVLHLMSNTQQVGLVLASDYLHLSRSLFALAGSVGSLYEGDRKTLLLQDLGKSLLKLPVVTVQDRFHFQIQSLKQHVTQRLWRWLPLPSFLKPTHAVSHRPQTALLP
jgi:predicted unusual protein kinase regulating ubiquinone biosynthesis (AarF/ABC1/UbiB family)